MQYQDYQDYKETSLNWIKPIPSHWKMARGKNLYRKENRKPNETDEVVTCFRDGQVTLRKNRRTEGFTESVKEVGYQGIRKGDLVIHVMDAFAGSIGVSDSDGKSTPVYSVCTPLMDINNYYYAYLLREMARTGFIQSLYRGIRERSSDFRFDVFGAQTYPVPPREEQDQIVRFLDWQTSQINKLIHGYQKQISLLQERRETLIDNAVTKGIASNKSMQKIESNWMGAIPCHWKMIPAKRLFHESKEKKLKEDKPATASQKYGIILQEDFMAREGRRIVIANQGLDEWKHVEPDDFVISLRSFQGGIERCLINGCVTWHYIVLKPQGHVHPAYFKWLFKSKSYIKTLQGTSEFIRDGQDLRYSNFVKIDLPLIPVEEQKQIAEYIEIETEKIDNALPILQHQIELLREYRTRLISDVVTGQIDVRGINIPDYEPEEDVSDDAEADEELPDEEESDE